MDAVLPSGSRFIQAAPQIAAVFNTGATNLIPHPIGPGLINATFRLSSHSSNQSFILQALNPNVFSNPLDVMQNTVSILNFLETEGHSFPTLPRLVPTRNDSDPWVVHDGVLWRCWHAVEPSVCYETVPSPELACAAGMAFGAFQHDLRNFPVSSLLETIPQFHHTPNRLEKLLITASEDPCQRLAQAQPEFDLLLSHQDLAHLIQDAINHGDVPLRATHNDTKISNILFHPHLNLPLCVIDLDTLMPGSLLHDFGDLVRTSLTPSTEDESKSPDPAHQLRCFKALASGFLSKAGQLLTPQETALLPASASVITYELAIRFLTDFLEGDLYFATSKPNHNLLRCQSQLELLASLEHLLPKMKTVIENKSLQNYLV